MESRGRLHPHASVPFLELRFGVAGKVTEGVQLGGGQWSCVAAHPTHIYTNVLIRSLRLLGSLRSHAQTKGSEGTFAHDREQPQNVQTEASKTTVA